MLVNNGMSKMDQKMIMVAWTMMCKVWKLSDDTQTILVWSHNVMCF